jgi:hypothetical protein
VGAHTDEILTDVLHLDEARTRELRGAGAFGR